MRQICKYLFLAWFGGSFYVTLEVFWRGRSHWSMFALAAFLFIAIGLLNEIWRWDFLSQILVGTALATVSELAMGIVVNLWLGWSVWDYSQVPGNVLGQICPQYTVLWVFIVGVAIILDDVIRWRFFHEEKPHYTLF